MIGETPQKHDFAGRSFPARRKPAKDHSEMLDAALPIRYIIPDLQSLGDYMPIVSWIAQTYAPHFPASPASICAKEVVSFTKLVAADLTAAAASIHYSYRRTCFSSACDV